MRVGGVILAAGLAFDNWPGSSLTFNSYLKMIEAMNRLSDMQLLVDAADLGSLSAAGRRAGLSPAAASACVQRIEAAVGARLFERTTRQLRLTDEGRTYLGYCRSAIDAMKEG